MSSPRKRGCFWYFSAVAHQTLVFPAQAGVFPLLRPCRASSAGLPRASGGVSFVGVSCVEMLRSSPRKRGCFPDALGLLWLADVFPAQAGVFLIRFGLLNDLIGLPRASGGVSTVISLARLLARSSPRKRGCFAHVLVVHDENPVFPAQAGVFPHRTHRPAGRKGLPRASGGVSAASLGLTRGIWSSPRKRGCFYGVIVRLALRKVFPAQAGVFPESPPSASVPRRLPRASGGVSEREVKFFHTAESSPRKRGCF